MKQKRIAQYCCAALVLVGMGLNIQNALTGYGLGENSLSLVATGGSGSSGSNSNSGSNSSIYVPNGKVSVIKNTHTCYSAQITSTTRTVTKHDQDGKPYNVTEYWYEYIGNEYYECELVDYDKVGWRELCKTPNSIEEAGCTTNGTPPDISLGGYWA
ncbi:MAG: hypothetical protein IJT28_01060 [Bacteroidaceae bacterium]|nr:hypothetical protein [Bacteroidaceae bacterium]